MADRVVVDRIDFREALVFPRVVAAAVGALRPPRLLLATFTLLCLVVLGRGYDAVRGPSVQPAGLLAPTRTSLDASVGGEMARRVARESLPTELRPESVDTLGARVDLEEVREALLVRRAEVSGAERDLVQRGLDRLEPYRGKGAFDALQTAVGVRFDGLVWAVVTLDGKAAARWPSHARALAPVRPVAAAGVGGRGEMSGNFGPGEARLPRPESRPDAGLQQPSHPSQAGRPAQRARRVQEPPQGTESQES